MSRAKAGYLGTPQQNVCQSPVPRSLAHNVYPIKFPVIALGGLPAIILSPSKKNSIKFLTVRLYVVTIEFRRYEVP